jgi:hypothetical protein
LRFAAPEAPPCEGGIALTNKALFLSDIDELGGESADVVPVTIAAPEHPEAKALLAYWEHCRTGGGMRIGRDIPSREIARLMSRLSVLEPVEERRDFRFRLVGSGWLRRFGRDVSGLRLSELYQGASFEHYVSGLAAVLESGRPNIVDVRIKSRLREMHHVEYVELPVESADGAQVWALTGAFHFD